MKVSVGRKKYTDWLLVSLLSASSRILETVSMILPVKAIFVLMKPEVLPDIWFESGFDMSHLMVLIVVLVGFTLLLGRVLHVMANRKAQDLHNEDEAQEIEQKALVTTKVTSSIFVMLIFANIIGYVNILALLLIMASVLVSQISMPFSNAEFRGKFFRLLGITKDEVRIRFVSQLLFLVYFMALLMLTMQQDMEITITLLLVMLVGRRFFGELTRFRRGLLQMGRAKSDNWAED